MRSSVIRFLSISSVSVARCTAAATALSFHVNCLAMTSNYKMAVLDFESFFWELAAASIMPCGISEMNPRS